MAGLGADSALPSLGTGRSSPFSLFGVVWKRPSSGKVLPLIPQEAWLLQGRLSRKSPAA